MNRSDQLNELASALAKAQGIIKQPSKSKSAVIKSDKGSYTYKYADLPDIIESYREPFSANGLSLVQSVSTEERRVAITTILLHASGQWIQDTLYMAVAENRPQAVGSAITYGRRYAAAAMVGIAPDEDDDGAGAEGAKQSSKPSVSPPPKYSSPKSEPGFDPQNRTHQNWFIKEMKKRGITDDRWDPIGDMLKGRPSSDLESVLSKEATQ